MKQRLDKTLLTTGLAESRSQAENLIKLGLVEVDGVPVQKAGHMVDSDSKLRILTEERYVSRAALKLASVADVLGIDFRGITMLDVGSSTGGFTDFALQRGADKVIAVDVGTYQMHPKLRSDVRVELHEQTDIREVSSLSSRVDLVVIDVSFVSLRDILPAIAKLIDSKTSVIAMVKPQFEAGQSNMKHKGVIKNDKIRRNILREFEIWVQNLFTILKKADSEVAGTKGNLERFYLLKIAK